MRASNFTEPDLRNRAFIHGNPTNARNFQLLVTNKGQYASPYWVYFRSVNSVNEASPDFDVGTNRSYVASGVSQSIGQSQAIVKELPVVPITSLGSLMHFKLGRGVLGSNTSTGESHSWDNAPYQMLGIGNSFAHPLINPGAVYTDNEDLVRNVVNQFGQNQYNRARDTYDDAFFMNDALWDAWFTSGITRQNRNYSGGWLSRLAEHVLSIDCSADCFES